MSHKLRLISMTHNFDLFFSLNDKLSLSTMPANSSETEMKCPETSPSSPTVKPTRTSTGSTTGSPTGSSAGSSSGSQKSDFFRTRLKAIEKRNRAKYSKKIKDCENSKASLYQEKLYTIIGGTQCTVH